MNVNEMNTRIESMSQTFRCLNGLNRYRREVDRHQNISNAQFFHGSKVDHQRRINLSLLVKGNSFLAHNRAALSQLSVLLFCRLRQKNGMSRGRRAQCRSICDNNRSSGRNDVVDCLSERWRDVPAVSGNHLRDDSKRDRWFHRLVRWLHRHARSCFERLCHCGQ